MNVLKMFFDMLAPSADEFREPTSTKSKKFKKRMKKKKKNILSEHSHNVRGSQEKTLINFQW